MPDLKIVELKPSKEADNNNVEVIRLLEEALQYAREGKSQSLALLMINNDGSVLDCWHNGGRPYVMVGRWNRFAWTSSMPISSAGDRHDRHHHQTLPPGRVPRHLDFLERMTVTKGTVEDWHALKSLHYKTDGKPFAPTYYRCELDDRLVGVVVMAYPKLLLAPRHRMFPKLKPTTNTTVANQYWGRYVNNNFAVIGRSVVDTQYRGVGVSYRMINLVSRMHDRPIIESSRR